MKVGRAEGIGTIHLHKTEGRGKTHQDVEEIRGTIRNQHLIAEGRAKSLLPMTEVLNMIQLRKKIDATHQ